MAEPSRCDTKSEGVSLLQDAAISAVFAGAFRFGDVWFRVGVVSLDQIPSAVAVVFFERRELEKLLCLYGRQVAAGEWRDYAIGGLREAAVFSVFRRASEAPIYRIEKRPALARRQGAWAVIGQGGHVLKRGHDLDQVLKLFDRGRLKLVE